MPQTSRTSTTKNLEDVFASQLVVQSCVDDDAFHAAASKRDQLLRRLTLRDRLRLKLAAGILERLVER